MTGYPTALAKASLSLMHQASSCSAGNSSPRGHTQVSAIPHALPLRSGGSWRGYGR